MGLDAGNPEHNDKINELMHGHRISEGAFTLEFIHDSPTTFHTYEELPIIKESLNPEEH